MWSMRHQEIWTKSVSLIGTSAHQRTHKLKFVDREPHGETWGRESNPHGQFLGPQKMQK